MQMSFALPARGAQFALPPLYSAAMLSFWALYSLFVMASAMAPALKARPIATATALMWSLFIVFPLVDWNAEGDCPPPSGFLLCDSAHSAGRHRPARPGECGRSTGRRDLVSLPGVPATARAPVLPS